MKNNTNNKSMQSPFPFCAKAVAAFCVTFSFCLIFTVITILNRSNVERLTMERLILEKSVKISEVLTKLIYKTNILAALVIQADGEIIDFEKTAATVIDDPAIQNVLIAPNGVVSDVYPLTGNEAVLGLDFFQDGAGNKEAVLAKDRGELVFGGPFTTVQGGQALVGRLPVYIDNAEGERAFWGLVSITLKYPEAMAGVGLELLENEGFAYEIWRVNPDDNQRQTIAYGENIGSVNARYIERHIPIYNADWYCRISPLRHWYEYSETWLLTFVGLVISALVAYVTQNNIILKKVQGELQEMSRMDSLTGIYNRRFFMELAHSQIDKALREHSETYVIMFDLDYFKEINDAYGHPAGDEVLRSVAGRVRAMLRSYDLMARYGGEEFIIFLTDLDKDAAYTLTERIRKAVAENAIAYEQMTLSVTASFGVAQVTPNHDLNTAIKYADEALYAAKHDGRNRVVLYGGVSHEA